MTSHPSSLTVSPGGRCRTYATVFAMVGVSLLVLLLLFAGIGRLVWDVSQTAPLSVPANRPPSVEHPLGTDARGGTSWR